MESLQDFYRSLNNQRYIVLRPQNLFLSLPRAQSQVAENHEEYVL